MAPPHPPSWPALCEHCQELAPRYSWRVVERYPRVSYERLCDRCQVASDDSFTGESAIAQAREIIAAVHQVARAMNRRAA